MQPVPANMGPLEFAAGSHKDDLGRGLNISVESERKIEQVLFW